MRSLVLALPLMLLACTAPPPDVTVGVTSRAPGQTLACITPKLDQLPLRYELHPTGPGWRMDLEVFSGPPAGWYRKGTITHQGRVVLYAPDGATRGIARAQVDRQIAPILRRCSRR